MRRRKPPEGLWENPGGILEPGEDLPGSLGAPDLVAWYTGHPDADRRFEKFQ